MHPCDELVPEIWHDFQSNLTQSATIWWCRSDFYHLYLVAFPPHDHLNNNRTSLVCSHDDEVQRIRVWLWIELSCPWFDFFVPFYEGWQIGKVKAVAGWLAVQAEIRTYHHPAYVSKWQVRVNIILLHKSWAYLPHMHTKLATYISIDGGNCD